MKPATFLIILPIMVEEVADKCIESLDETIKNNLLIIDNSPNGFAKKYNIRCQHYPENIGVARSWNIAVKEVVDKKLDYLIILSAAIVFENGMLDFIEALNAKLYVHDEQRYCIETEFSWHCTAIGREVFEKIGYFDENFYPAYYEETDFIRRMELAGMLDPINASNRCTVSQISAIRQGVALSIKHGLKVDFTELSNYFIEKWGDIGGWESQEQRDRMYTHPFNDPTKPLSYWEEHSIKELKEKYKL